MPRFASDPLHLCGPPSQVSIIAPADVKEMYGHKSPYLKGPFYDVCAPVSRSPTITTDSNPRTQAWSIGGAKNHFSDRDPQTHANRRRAVANAYALNHLVSLERFVDKHTDVLFEHFDKAAQASSQVDLAEYIECEAPSPAGVAAQANETDDLAQGSLTTPSRKCPLARITAS